MIIRALAVVAAFAPAIAHARYAVGITTQTFTKTSVTTGAPRPLTTYIWYPALPKTGTREALGLRDATAQKKRFPLVVFSHGTCGLPTEATYLTKALAAEGYVVAAMAHPGNLKTDGAACLATVNFLDSAANRLPDVRFTLDAMLALDADPSSPFAGRLRRDAIGMSGLSFGGFTTLLASQQEPRFRASLVLGPGGTGVLGPTPIAIPTMVIGAEHDHVVGFAESEKAYARLAGPRFLVELLAADHLALTDDCAPLCGPNDVPQATAHKLILHYALPFFRSYLGKARSASTALRHRVRGVELTVEAR